MFANADEPGTGIVAARRSTPLVLGVGDGEMFLGSDVAAFIEHTRDAVELGQDQWWCSPPTDMRSATSPATQMCSTASFASTGI